MSFSPVLALHISSGTLGLLSGAVAMSFRKGSRRHGVAGNVFVVSMLCLGLSGAYMAFFKQQAGNFMGGIFTAYMVATAWLTVRRREGETGILDWGALLAALTLGTAYFYFGIEVANGRKTMEGGVPAPAYFIFGTLTLLAAAGDVRLLVRGSLSNTQRLVRHLWRMCFAWFVASGSIFLARPHLFPIFMRTTGMLVALGFLPLALMIFWLIRVRVAKVYKKRPASTVGGAYSLRLKAS